MAEETEIKVSKSYSLDPALIAWVAKKAARLTAENLEKGQPRVSDSQLVNDILTAAMEDDKTKTAPKIPLPTQSKKNARPIAVAA